MITRVSSFLLIALASWAFSTKSHASVWEEMSQQQPSVWEEQAQGTPQEVQITDVQVKPSAVQITINKKNKLGEKVSEKVRVCLDDTKRWDSEAGRTMHLNQRVQALREAKKTQETVRLNERGFWDPCVTPTSI